MPDMLGEHREALLLEDGEQPTVPTLKRFSAAPTRRRLVILLALAASASAGVTVSAVVRRRRLGARGPFGARQQANLVFEQDFSRASELDPAVWNLARTLSDDPHQSFQMYTDDRSVLYINASDGTLRIAPGLFAELVPLETVPGHPPYLAEDVMRGTCTPYPACATFKLRECTGRPELGACEATGGAWSSLGPTVVKPTTSAQLDTRGKFEFTYGRVEIRLRLPAGDWLWPSFLLLAATDRYGSTWPLSGQVNLVESRGNGPAFTLNGQPAGRDVATSSFHYGENMCARRRRCPRARPPRRALGPPPLTARTRAPPPGPGFGTRPARCARPPPRPPPHSRPPSRPARRRASAASPSASTPLVSFGTKLACIRMCYWRAARARASGAAARAGAAGAAPRRRSSGSST